MVDVDLAAFRRAENALFEEWQKKRPYLLRDGLVNEEKYFASSPRVVFVLKDAYDKDHGGKIVPTWTLLDYVREQAAGKTWVDLCRWAQGLARLNEKPRWDELQNCTVNADRAKLLENIGVVNLKKEMAAQSQTNWEELKTYAEEDAGFIRQQLTLYQPDIIICCGMYFLFTRIMKGAEDSGKVQTRRGAPYTRWEEGWEGGAWVLNSLHPAAQIGSRFKCFNVLDSVAELLKI